MYWYYRETVLTTLVADDEAVDYSDVDDGVDGADSIDNNDNVLDDNTELLTETIDGTNILADGNLAEESISRSYKCTVCSKGFKKSSHLKQHLQIHTGIKHDVGFNNSSLQ